MLKRISVIIVIGVLSASAVFSAVPEKLEDSFDAQYKLASNTALPMSARWKALLAAAELANADQIQKVLAFSKDKDWFMRNATLIALEKIESDIVYDKAKELMTDKALVVRSAAVEVLSRLSDSSVRRIFSAEMTKKYNFNGKTSLWIRPQMMKYLAQKPVEEDKAYFMQFINDSDTQVSLYSIQALEKLTNVRFSGKDKSSVVAQWQKFAKDNKW